MSADNEKSFNRPIIYWKDEDLDLLTVGIIQQELLRRESLRKKNAKKDGAEGRPVTIDLESLRVALESETRLRSITTIDDSIRRVAVFNEEYGGISNVKSEVLERLQRPEK